MDDSIVRGTTMKRIVALLKGAGAQEIHVRIASPEMAYPCFYGVDTSTKKELISARYTCEELCKYTRASSVRFLTIDDLIGVYGTDKLCFACFSGNYVTPLFHDINQKTEK